MSVNLARQAPVLETARLILRPFQASDLEAQARTMGDPEVVRHLGGTPFSREDTWRRLLCAPGRNGPRRKKLELR